VKMLKYCWSIT